MAENQEKIEGRLCEYIEGTLDATGVAEIEKHLANNPQHRRLLDELMRSRALMRQLPRTSAPAEINEHLQAQLERAALLGDLAEEMPRESMRISPWPRIRAIAAVLLLAAGLGAVIYFVLPGARPNSGEYAQLKPDATGATTLPSEELALRTAGPSVVPATAPSLALASPPLTAAGASASHAMIESPAPISRATPTPAETVAPVVTLDSAAPGATGGSAGTNLDGVEASRALADAGLTREQLERNGVGPNLVPIVLRTDNPILCNVEVERTLADNKIPYESVAKSAWLNDAVTGKTLVDNSVSSNAAAASTSNAYRVNAPGENAALNAAKDNAPAPAASAPPPSADEKQAVAANANTNGSADAEKSALNKQQDQAAANRALAGRRDTDNPAAQAQHSPQRLQQQENVLAETTEPANSARSATQPSRGFQFGQQQQQQQFAGGEATGNEQLYIARRLTRRQAVELNNTLQTNTRAGVTQQQPRSIEAIGGGGGGFGGGARDRYGVDLRGWQGDNTRAARGATTVPATVPTTQSDVIASSGAEARPTGGAGVTEAESGKPKTELAGAAGAGATTPPTPADVPIQPGETIEFKIGQQGGPAVVADDGKVLLPTGDIVTAAGLTPAALQKELRSKLATSKVPMEVSVARVPPPSEADKLAADFASRKDVKAESRDAQQPAAIASNAEPATRPTSETSDEDRVDVVIVVRNDTESPLQQTPSQAPALNRATEPAATSTQPAGVK